MCLSIFGFVNHGGAVMPVFCCVNQNYDRLLVKGRSKAVIEEWFKQHVENFVPTEINKATDAVLLYAKKYGDPIINVKEKRK